MVLFMGLLEKAFRLAPRALFVNAFRCCFAFQVKLAQLVLSRCITHLGRHAIQLGRLRKVGFIRDAETRRFVQIAELKAGLRVFLRRGLTQQKFNRLSDLLIGFRAGRKRVETLQVSEREIVLRIRRSILRCRLQVFDDLFVVFVDLSVVLRAGLDIGQLGFIKFGQFQLSVRAAFVRRLHVQVLGSGTWQLSVLGMRLSFHEQLCQFAHRLHIPLFDCFGKVAGCLLTVGFAVFDIGFPADQHLPQLELRQHKTEIGCTSDVVDRSFLGREPLDARQLVKVHPTQAIERLWDALIGRHLHVPNGISVVLALPVHQTQLILSSDMSCIGSLFVPLLHKSDAFLVRQTVDLVIQVHARELILRLWKSLVRCLGVPLGRQLVTLPSTRQPRLMTGVEFGQLAGGMRFCLFMAGREPQVFGDHFIGLRARLDIGPSGFIQADECQLSDQAAFVRRLFVQLYGSSILRLPVFGLRLFFLVQTCQFELRSYMPLLGRFGEAAGCFLVAGLVVFGIDFLVDQH